MGCCGSSFLAETNPLRRTKLPNNHCPTATNQSFGAGRNLEINGVPTLSVLLSLPQSSLQQLQLRRHSFRERRNVVYKGRRHNNKWIAVKKFAKTAWPDPDQFADEGRDVGKLRHPRLANLIGYCFDGDQRVLVAYHMPDDTLAKHLFHFLQIKSHVMLGISKNDEAPIAPSRLLPLSAMHDA